jgi:hypothetical protein
MKSTGLPASKNGVLFTYRFFKGGQFPNVIKGAELLFFLNNIKGPWLPSFG